VQLILGHDGLEWGQLKDLVTQRLHVRAGQDVPAAPAGRGLADNRMIGGQQGPALQGMALLTAGRKFRGSAGRAALDAGEVGGRRSRGVRRILAEALLEVVDLLLELYDMLLEGLVALFLLLEEGAQFGLCSSGDLLPQVSRDWRLRRHAPELQTGPSEG
jgi:hypothetical protein